MVISGWTRILAMLILWYDWWRKLANCPRWRGSSLDAAKTRARIQKKNGPEINLGRTDYLTTEQEQARNLEIDKKIQKFKKLQNVNYYELYFQETNLPKRKLSTCTMGWAYYQKENS